MNRFGRSAQQKMKDRWGGGSFILATVLAIGAAWWAGTLINKWVGQGQTAGTDSGYSDTAGKGGGNHTVAEPHQFDLYFAQVGAYRSEAGAKTTAQKLSEQNHAAMVAPRTERGFYPVFAGVYTSAQTYNEAKTQLVSEGSSGTMLTKITVAHKPDAIPTAAMGNKSGDIKVGLDTLNTYLYEVAAWMESQTSSNPMDTTTIVDLGKKLGDFATAMGGEKDAKVKQLADLAAMASSNATAVQGAATAAFSSTEYQTVMTGYLTLLNQYNGFTAAK